MAISLLSVLKSVAQHENDYAFRQFVSGKDTLNYRMLVPENDGTKQFPVVLFLHGAGERGHDNIAQLNHGSKLFYTMRDDFPAIVIFPQCPKDDYWANVNVDRRTNPITLKFPKNSPPTQSMSLVMELMEAMLTKPYVDRYRVYVGGPSMGGMGTFEILFRKPELFAAAFAICGAGNPETTGLYAKTIPMWIFHGANDDVVDPQESVRMVSSILDHGGQSNFSLYSKDNHNSWDSAFAEPELVPWLFSNSKSK